MSCLVLAEMISILEFLQLRGAVYWICDLLQGNVRNTISPKRQCKEMSCNLPQRSWCKDTIIRISYYLVHRVCIIGSNRKDVNLLTMQYEESHVKCPQ